MSPALNDPMQDRLPIPDLIDAPLTLCFFMNVPNDPTYLEHLWGTLQELASGWAYQNDTGHNAAAVAQKWEVAIQSAKITTGDCMLSLQLRACSSPDCGLEFSTDGGVTWTCIGLNGCIADIVGAGIDGAISDGLLGRAGGQPGPTSRPPATECKTYHVVLRGNDRWLLPSPIGDGDGITVTNAVGGWTDGTLEWECPDGQAYVLGACTGDRTALTGDPLMTVNHMRLIMGVNDTTPVYHDVLAGLVTIPGGTGNQAVWFQANDGLLSDNGGQIEFDVTVCTAGLWCYDFDFTVSEQGWYAFTGSLGTSSYYHAPSGWGVGDGNYNIIRHTLSGAADIWYADIYRDFVPDGGRDLFRFFASDGSLQTSYTPTSTDDAFGIHHSAFDLHTTGSVGAAYVEIFGDRAAGSGNVREVRLRGIMGNPFGSDNCVP